MTTSPLPTVAPTACAPLVIIPCTPNISPTTTAAVGQFILLPWPSGRRVAVADEPAALHHLAEQLAWFDDNATDPNYLDDPANADICQSLRELFQHWCAVESDYGPQTPFFAGAHNQQQQCRPRGR
jgi:hypothetical protein